MVSTEQQLEFEFMKDEKYEHQERYHEYIKRMYYLTDENTKGYYKTEEKDADL